MNNKREFFDHAIVFNVKEIGDNNLLIKFLTPSYGMITSFAFGGRKSKRRFSGCFEELSHVLFKVTSPRHGNYLYLEEGILIDRFSNIHREFTKFGVAVNCQKFLEAIVIEQMEAKAIFHFFLNLLKVLDNHGGPIFNNIPIFFRARIAKEIGFMPQIQSCNGCGRLLKSEMQVFFSPERGKLFCKECISATNGYILFNKTAYNLFLKILTLQPNKWIYNKEESLEEQKVAHGLKRFVEVHLKISWQKGKFVLV